jgi:hypothetical protein
MLQAMSQCDGRANAPVSQDKWKRVGATVRARS